MRLQHHQDHILHGVDANPVEGKDSNDKKYEGSILISTVDQYEVSSNN